MRWPTGDSAWWVAPSGERVLFYHFSKGGYESGARLPDDGDAVAKRWSAIRDELILAAPRYLQCRDDCRGLCPRCGQDLNAGPCGCAPEPDPRWSALYALRERLRDQRGD